MLVSKFIVLSRYIFQATFIEFIYSKLLEIYNLLRRRYGKTYINSTYSCILPHE